MIARKLTAVFVLSLGLGAYQADAQSLRVSHEAGLLDIHCENEPLSNVFNRIEQEIGVSLIIEPAVEAKMLSASFQGVPVAMAVQRILEGTGVVYAVMMDRRQWGRVDKIFIGAGGGGPARQAPPPRPVRQEPEEDPFDEMEDELDQLDEVMDELDEDGVPPPQDPTALTPPTTNLPVPSYLPPQQSFPRSTFTPGPPSASPAQAPGGGAFPLTDAFGRPIPAPGQQPDPDPDPERRQE